MLGLKLVESIVTPMFYVLKSVPPLGGPLELIDFGRSIVDGIKQEQFRHDVHERFEQLQETINLTKEDITELCEKISEEIRNKGEVKIPKNRQEAITETATIIPITIKQRINSTLNFAERKNIAPLSALPIENSSPNSVQNQFYHSLIPKRRPRFKQGTPVPHRKPWFFEELIGMGGFGEVWKISHGEGFGEEAIKVCLEQHNRDMLKKETNNIIYLKDNLIHENIVKVKDIYTGEEPYFIQLEYVEGGTLDDLIRGSGGPLDFEEIKDLFTQICDAVSEAHRIELIHRDLKPANILIDKNNTPKITDFGLGRILVENLTATNSSNSMTMAGFGTPGYMSPEQQNSESAHFSDDVYALGIILYQMITGRLSIEPQYIRTYLDKMENSDDLKKLQEVVLECVEHPRNERPSNAKELLKKFDKACRSVERKLKKKKKKNKKKENKKKLILLRL